MFSNRYYRPVLIFHFKNCMYKLLSFFLKTARGKNESTKMQLRRGPNGGMQPCEGCLAENFLQNVKLPSCRLCCRRTFVWGRKEASEGERVAPVSCCWIEQQSSSVAEQQHSSRVGVAAKSASSRSSSSQLTPASAHPELYLEKIPHGKR